MRPRAILSWSSGKDCAWALHKLRERDDVEVVGLLTTFNASAGRVAMHAVRRELVQAQADAVGLPLTSIELPWPCSNEAYEGLMAAAVGRMRNEGIDRMAFGDLFLEDVRDYRVARLAGTGVDPMFPLWGTPDDTPGLARRMIAAGIRAVLTCVDPARLPERFAGRSFDQGLLDDLPPDVDPCGERGEFHTFCFAGPMFRGPIAVSPGESVTRDGFRFADLRPAATMGDLTAGAVEPEA